MAKHVVMLLSNQFRPDPRVHKEARALVEAGYEVTIISWDRTGEYPTEENIDGIKIIRTGKVYPGRSFLAFSVYLCSFYLKAFGIIRKLKPDIIHAHDFDTLPLGTLASALLGTDLVYDAHELYADMIKDDAPGCLVNLVKKTEKCLVKKVDFLLCTTGAFKKIYRRMRVKKVIVIMGCPDYSSITSEEISSFRKTLGDDNQTIVQYIGVLEPVRSLIPLVKLFKKESLKDHKLIIGGFGSLEKPVKRLSRQIDNVDFIGPVTPDKIPLYNHASDILIALYNPKNRNNRLSVPNKLFEAMDAGKPIIVSRKTYTGKVVNETGCGMTIKYGNIAQLERTLIILGKGSQEAAIIGRNGKKAAANKYNWKVMANRLIAAYSKL